MVVKVTPPRNESVQARTLSEVAKNLEPNQKMVYGNSYLFRGAHIVFALILQGYMPINAYDEISGEYILGAIHTAANLIQMTETENEDWPKYDPFPGWFPARSDDE